MVVHAASAPAVAEYTASHAAIDAVAPALVPRQFAAEIVEMIKAIPQEWVSERIVVKTVPDHGMRSPSWPVRLFRTDLKTFNFQTVLEQVTIQEDHDVDADILRHETAMGEHQGHIDRAVNDLKTKKEKLEQIETEKKTVLLERVSRASTRKARTVCFMKRRFFFHFTAPSKRANV